MEKNKETQNAPIQPPIQDQDRQNTAIPPELIEMEKNRMELESAFKGGAGWFYWIAGLSLINSIIVLAKGKWNFVIGLGITQIIDAIGQHIQGIGPVISIVLNLIVLGVFMVIGVLCMKRFKWAFWIGMGLYAIDGLIFLLTMDLLAIGFHAFALFGIYSGYVSLNKLEALEKTMPANSVENPA